MKKIIYYIILGCSLLTTTSCGDWLNVNPKTRTEQKEMFESEKGFKDALIGVYIGMKDKSLYGKNMTMEFIEDLAQHWETSSGSVNYNVNKYKYDNIGVEGIIRKIYQQYYNTIINATNILTFVDNGVLNDDMYALIKGELLAARAYCQFDLLRLYGPIPGKQDDKKILAYDTQVSKDPQKMHTWDEYVKFLENDLNEAEKLLKEVDMKGIDDDFFKFRENRMNYWAVLALKARFYLWIQNKEKAAEYANMIIKSQKFRLCNSEDFTKNNLIASTEHIFALHSFDMSKTAYELFFRAGGLSNDEDLVKEELFENDITDCRQRYLWANISEEHGMRFIMKKYKQDEVPENTTQLIPMIRLYEMYLIAIECSDVKTVYEPLMEALILARDISKKETDKNKFIIKEYQKEFYGEGQQFFLYKRLNSATIMWSTVVANRDVYVIPLPKNE